MAYFRNSTLRKLHLKQRHKYVKKDYLAAAHWDELDLLAEAYGSMTTLQMYEIESVQLPHLLKYADRNSMAHGIESRLPFLDYRLVEAIVSAPTSLKLKEGWSKYLLRRIIAPHVPNCIAWRRNKVGFEAPRDSYIDCENISDFVAKSELLSQICRKDVVIGGKDRWKLETVHSWEKTFDVKL
jgi:asparagine synthase (glutamine-hydrolysing)